MSVKPKYIVGKTPEELVRIKEEYEMLGYHVSLQGDMLMVHLLPPQKKRPVKTDDDDDDTNRRTAKRERKFGYARGVTNEEV